MKGFPGGFGLTTIYEGLLTMEEALSHSPGKIDSLISEMKKISDLMDSISQDTFKKGERHSDTVEQSTQQINKNPPVHKILVAEDNRMNQEIIQYLLKKMELQYKMVENGSDAMRELSSGSFDLFLLDMRMPVMNGMETIKAIRSHTELKNIPVIAMTANALSNDEILYRQAGCNDYLPKPLDLDELEKKITKLIS